MTLRAVFLCCGMSYSGDFPGGLDGKASVYNVGAWVRSLGREDPLEKEMDKRSTDYLRVFGSITCFKCSMTKESMSFSPLLHHGV